jgi:hypothetical protein
MSQLHVSRSPLVQLTADMIRKRDEQRAANDQLRAAVLGKLCASLGPDAAGENGGSLPPAQQQRGTDSPPPASRGAPREQPATLPKPRRLGFSLPPDHPAFDRPHSSRPRRVTGSDTPPAADRTGGRSTLVACRLKRQREVGDTVLLDARDCAYGADDEHDRPYAPPPSPEPDTRSPPSRLPPRSERDVAADRAAAIASRASAGDTSGDGSLHFTFTPFGVQRGLFDPPTPVAPLKPPSPPQVFPAHARDAGSSPLDNMTTRHHASSCVTPLPRTLLLSSAFDLAGTPSTIARGPKSGDDVHSAQMPETPATAALVGLLGELEFELRDHSSATDDEPEAIGGKEGHDPSPPNLIRGRSAAPRNTVTPSRRLSALLQGYDED